MSDLCLEVGEVGSDSDTPVFGHDPLSDPADSSIEEILNPEGIEEAVSVLADQVESACSPERSVFIGIFTRGVTVARRVAKVLKGRGLTFEVGSLDVSLYRDDFGQSKRSFPRLASSEIPFPIDETEVILFDEVIFTGRTIRAALDGLMDYGRPSKVELAVLIDRGHREIPIQADYVGHTLETNRDDYVQVRFQEDDDREGVFLARMKGGSDE
ncbi:MAG: bifunctional pyr operon transcriptional regulator/uracil phosphoribosyltransferase PyrR [Verrucomicrobiota bacterium]